jgi:hypothetical protein
MIRVAHCQHDGFFPVIAWDPRILLVDSLAAGTNERARCYFQEAPCVSTLHGNIVGSRCSTYFRLVWDLGVIISVNLV